MVSSLKRKPTVTIIMRAWASRPNLHRNHSIKKPKQEKLYEFLLYKARSIV
jgi:hypothetical protein